MEDLSRVSSDRELWIWSATGARVKQNPKKKAVMTPQSVTLMLQTAAGQAISELEQDSHW